MQKVGHDFLRQRPVFRKKDVVDIKKRNVRLAAQEVRQTEVDFFHTASQPFVLFLSVRKNVQHDDLEFRIRFLEPFDDGSDPVGDHPRRVGAVAGVVRSDHKHSNLRLNLVERKFVQPPKNVLRLVTAETEVDWLEFTEVFVE